jgi:hypothetical protein
MLRDKRREEWMQSHQQKEQHELEELARGRTPAHAREEETR